MAPSYLSMGTFLDLEISILSRLALVIAQVSLWHSDYLIVYPYSSPCIARITVKDSRRYYANNSIYSSITGLGWAVLVFGLNSKLVCVLARGRFVFSNSKFLRHELHERCIPLGYPARVERLPVEESCPLFDTSLRGRRHYLHH